MNDAAVNPGESLLKEWLAVEGDLDDFIFYAGKEDPSEK